MATGAPSSIFKKACAIIAIAACAALSHSSLSAAVLFSEDFQSASAGQLWNGYNSWVGTGSGTNADIIGGNGGLVGHFVGTPSASGIVTHDLADTYSLSTSAYRLSFDVSGALTRGFNVYLADDSNQQIGFRLGNNGTVSDDFKVGGYTRRGTTTTYSYAYNSPNPGGVAPANFSSTAFYTVNLDINMTDQTQDIFGAPLEAGKIRITYNVFGVGGMAVYSVTFDPPAGMDSISSIGVQKAIATTLQYSIDNLVLQSVPEPSISALLPIGGILILALRLNRNRMRM